IRGFEALVRWRTKDGLVISPSEFVHIAEEAGFMNDLGEWVLQNGMKEAVVWNVEHGMNWILSVNISVSQIRNEGFSDYILKLLSDNNYEAQLLEIEVTETKMATSDDRVFIELKKLRENGIRIAIDDFGMGYSSFDYLRWMPFHVLKIDKSFVDRLVDQEIEAAIVDSIIKLVERLDLEIIAEGVETEEQLEILRKTSCNYIQGYVYSRPISQEKVLQLIQEERVIQ
ncbi:MAG: EAL domain-containing protein, partial [Vallitaleaceae bacterium]|nr:EAL domain-containing protein [Vallitaleaceae bacterium]